MFEEIIPTLQEWFALYGLRIIGALAIFVIGRWVAKGLRGALSRVLTKRKVEATLISFTVNLSYAALVTFVVLAALNQLGFQTASFIAVIGAAGLAIGLALQGSLANFASGVLIIIFRPMVVGDFVDAAGVAGKVTDLDIFTTTLLTPDNKTIVIPNGNITGGPLTNFSRQETRRVDMVFGVSYGDDIRKVKEIIWDVLNSDERILKDPEPTVALLALADSSINFAVRPWVQTAQYWDVFFHLNETLKMRFDEEGISIPFPQRDVHLFPVPHEEGGDTSDNAA